MTFLALIRPKSGRFWAGKGLVGPHMVSSISICAIGVIGALSGVSRHLKAAKTGKESSLGEVS